MLLRGLLAQTREELSVRRPYQRAAEAIAHAAIAAHLPSLAVLGAAQPDIVVANFGAPLSIRRRALRRPAASPPALPASAFRPLVRRRRRHRFFRDHLALPFRRVHSHILVRFFTGSHFVIEPPLMPPLLNAPPHHMPQQIALHR